MTFQATADALGLYGLDDVTASGANLSVLVNRGDGSTLIDYAADALDVATSASGQVSLDVAGSRGEVTQLAGDLELDLFGLVSVSGSMAVTQDAQTLTDTDGDTYATTVLSVGANDARGFVGVDGQGLALADLDMALAFITQSGVSTPRTWSALDIAVGSLSVAGVDGLTASASNFVVQVNQGDTDGQPAIDFGASALVVATSASTTRSIEFDDAVNLASGTITLDAFGVAQIQGDLAVQAQTRDVVLSDGATLHDVNLVTIGGTNLNGFVGVNGGSDDQKGLDLTGLEFGLAMVTDDAGQQFQTVQASLNSASIVGLDQITAQVNNLLVNVNRGIDWPAAAATTRNVDSQYQLAYEADFEGDLTFSRGGNSATVAVDLAQSSADIRAELTTELSALLGASVTVSGNRAGGFTITIGGARSGQDIDDLTGGNGPNTDPNSQRRSSKHCRPRCAHRGLGLLGFGDRIGCSDRNRF